MLAILTTHPIQYQVPLWKALAQDGRIPFEVWYLSNHGTTPTFDIQFGKTFAWDIDTLSGYSHRFLKVSQQADVNRFMGLRFAEPIEDLMQQRGTRVLWIQGWQVAAYWQAVWTADRQGIPVWLRAETNDLHRPKWYKRLPRQLLLKQLFDRVSRFLYIGSANRRFYRGLGVPESKLVAAPYFVDNERFAYEAREMSANRNFLRQQWSIPEGAICFLFCGKFMTKKRPLDLLTAAQILIEQYSRSGQSLTFHLLMVGEGELRPCLEEKARELALIVGHSVVSFTGFLNQSEITKAYVAADCLILPSDAGETWGLVVNEALACGCPAIVSDLCGCAQDLSRCVEEDVVFTCGNVAALSDKMQTQITRLNQTNERKTYIRYLQEHNMSRTLESVVDTYKDVLS